jgi:hypothetical protein
MSEQHTPVQARRGVDRRAVVRAGVWTVPAVTLATAAPALAATSVTTGGLRFNFLSLYGAAYDPKGKARQAESQTSIQNQWAAGAPTVTSIIMTVTYSDSRVTGTPPTLVSGTGWSFSGPPKRSGGDWLYTFVWVGSLAPSASTPMLTWRVPLKNMPSGNMSISAHATATNVTGADITASTNL